MLTKEIRAVSSAIRCTNYDHEEISEFSSTGIRNGSSFKAARFVYPINRALTVAIQKETDKVQLTFVPRSEVPEAPEGRASVRIARIRLILQTEQRR